jgi:hypothetical protein
MKKILLIVFMAFGVTQANFAADSNIDKCGTCLTRWGWLGEAIGGWICKSSCTLDVAELLAATVPADQMAGEKVSVEGIGNPDWYVKVNDSTGYFGNQTFSGKHDSADWKDSKKLKDEGDGCSSYLRLSVSEDDHVTSVQANATLQECLVGSDCSFGSGCYGTTLATISSTQGSWFSKSCYEWTLNLDKIADDWKSAKMSLSKGIANSFRC